jgi:uncharacterized membrane protein
VQLARAAATILANMHPQCDYRSNGVSRASHTHVLAECHEAFQSLLWRLALITHCHQLTDRSFSLRGRQVPLCARCSGILVGVFLIPLYVVDLRFAATLIAAMVLDGGSQALKLRTSNNWLRFATGIGFALGCGGLLERGISYLWNM